MLVAGCGYGREIKFLIEKECEIYAIDILQSMIENAKKSYGYIAKEIKVDNIENTSFHSEMFDKIICWATFECLDQDMALCDMIRITKIGGNILITGKNIEYFDDDKLAYIAEKKALEKNFPNNFTDVDKLISILPSLGLKLILCRIFKYRGDFSFNKFENFNSYDNKFYEYVLILKKIENKKFNKKLSIFDNYSKNYRTII